MTVQSTKVGERQVHCHRNSRDRFDFASAHAVAGFDELLETYVLPA
jgi:hypothetical protein